MAVIKRQEVIQNAKDLFKFAEKKITGNGPEILERWAKDDWGMQFARDTDGEMNHPLCIPIIWKKERLQLYTPLQHIISAQR